MYPWLLGEGRKTKFRWESIVCPAIYKGHIIKSFHLLSTSGPHILLGPSDTMENKTNIPILQKLLSSARRQTMNPRKMSNNKTNTQIIEIGWVTKDGQLVSLGPLCKWCLLWDLNGKKDLAMWAPGGNHPRWRAGHRQSPKGRHKAGFAKRNRAKMVPAWRAKGKVERERE